MFEYIDPGLGVSLQLKAVGRGGGTSMGATDGICRGIEAALVCEVIGELVEETMLVAILRSSIALSLGPAEMGSYCRSDAPPNAATTSDSDIPLSWSNALSFLFSSRTFLAALWISEEASMPICS